MIKVRIKSETESQTYDYILYMKYLFHVYFMLIYYLKKRNSLRLQIC